MSIELEKQLLQAQNELDALRRDFDEYAYMVSHDLAAPFRQIEGFANIILENHGNEFDEKTKRHFDIIVKGAEKGAGILENLLTYSRLCTTGTMDATSVNCNSIIAEVSAQLLTEFENSQVQYCSANLPIVEGDATQVTTLFYEIMRNGLLYHRPEAEPVVSLEATESQEVWEFCVRDEGIGISGNLKDKVFMVLKRGVSDKNYAGAGLGLAVAKRIVQNHRGKIWLEPNEGAGCSFYFTLPKTLGNSEE